MKFLGVLLSLAFFVGAFAAPQATISDNEIVAQDETSKQTIEKMFAHILDLSSDNEIAKAFIKSIDRDCMLRKYKQHKFIEDLLTEEAIDLVGIQTESKSIDSALVFINIALTCSNKLNALLGFVFDNTISYSSLLDAFREDEPIKGFIDDLTCYNNYAVRKEYLNPAAYSHLNYKLVNETEQECDDSIKETKDGLIAAVEMFSEAVTSDNRKCLEKEIYSTAERFFFRYGLLIPVGLTDEQKKTEKANFIKDAIDGLEKLLLCNVTKSGGLATNEISKK